MAVETREMSSFTLTRSPQHVAISATQVTTTGAAGGGSVAVVKTESTTFSSSKAAIRQVSGSNTRCGGTRSTAARDSRGNERSEAVTATVAGKSVETMPKPKPKEDEAEGGKENSQVVAKRGWLLRRYSVLAEELNSSEERSEKTIAEKCTNCCFQAYIVCRKSNCRASPQINTQQLSKARTLGIKSALFTIGSDLFSETPVGSIVREFVVYGGSFFMFALWVSAIVGFILHIVRRNDNRGGPFLAGEVAISSCGMILTVIDLLQHMCIHRCKSCKEGTRGPEWHSETPDRFELSAAHEHNDGDNELKGCCKKHRKYDRAGIVRFFVTPLIVYPLLLLNILNLLSEIIINEVNITTILSFVLIVIVQIWFVYLVRIFIYLGMVHSIQKVRTGGANGRALLKDSYFQLYFVVSAIGQMVVELLIIATIGINMYDDYLVFLNTTKVPLTFIPSPQLWYMMVFGYFATPVGLALFFITHYYCTQRFFIKFYLDMLYVLENKANIKSAYSKNGALPDFKNMEETNCGHKCIYSFISPTIVLLSILYVCSAVAFIYCSFSLEGTIASVNQPYNSQLAIIEVAGFFLGAGIVAILMNFYTMAVAFLWILAVCLFFGIVALAILLIPLIFLCLFCYCIIKDPPPPAPEKPDAPPHIYYMPHSTWTYQEKTTYKKSPYS